MESIKSDKALRRVEKFVLEDSAIKAFVGTTTAVDIIGGGVKASVLEVGKPAYHH